MSSNGKDTFTTSRGKTVRLAPVSPFLIEKLRASLPMPTAPTYTITTAAGSTEVHTHDEESIKTATPEEQAAWRAYQRDLDARRAAVNDRTVRLILVRGVDVEIDENGWDAEQADLGIVVPTSPNDRKAHYILTEVVGVPTDLTEILVRSMELSGVSAEDVEAARNSFRDSLRGTTPVEPESAGAGIVEA